MTRYFPEVVEAILANTARALRARRRDRRRAAATGSTSRRCSSGSTPRPAGSTLLAARDAGVASSPSTCSRSATTTCMDRPFRERRGGCSRPWRAPSAPVHVTRATADMALARDGSRSSRAPGWTASSPSRWTALPARQADDVQDQARADRRLRRGRLPLAQERAGASARCCSASTTTTGELQHVGVVGVVPDGPRAGAARRAGSRCVTDAADGPPVGRTGRTRRRQEAAQLPGHRAAGTRARTCRSCRCGRSWSSRSPTTRWRATGSGTRRSSAAGAPTGRRSRARTSSSTARWLRPGVRPDLRDRRQASRRACARTDRREAAQYSREGHTGTLTRASSTCWRYPSGAPHSPAHRVDPRRGSRHGARLALRPGGRHPRPGGHRPVPCLRDARSQAAVQALGRTTRGAGGGRADRRHHPAAVAGQQLKSDVYTGRC